MPAALAIVLGGTDITAKVDMTSVVMQLAGSQEVASCEFDILDPTDTVTAEDEATLTVTEVGTAEVLFGGFCRSRRVVVITTGRIIHVSAVDYNSLLDRSIVVSDSRAAGESDTTRLAYLMTTYGTQFSSDYSQIATLNISLPAQKFIAITLRQAIERVLGQASTKASYYCDPTGRLVTYDRTVPVAAPFNVRVGTPGGGELAPETFSIDNDASNLANAIYIVGATAAGSGWFTDVTSIAAYGRRERFYNAPDSDTSAKAMQVGLAVLEDQKNPVPRGVFTTQSPKDGWRIGQSIVVNSDAHDLVNATYRIAKVSAHYLSGTGTREYTIEIGAPLPSLSALLGATHGGGGGFPWHSPGGAGAWVGVIGHGDGGVSSRGPCACPPFFQEQCFEASAFSEGGDGNEEIARSWEGTSVHEAAPTFAHPIAGAFSPKAHLIWASGDPDIALEAVNFYSVVMVATGTSARIRGAIGASTSAGPDRAVDWELRLGLWGSSAPTTLVPAGTILASGTTLASGSGNWTEIEVIVPWSPGGNLQLALYVISPHAADASACNLTVILGPMVIDPFDGWVATVGDMIDCGDPEAGQLYPWTSLGMGNGTQTAFAALTPFAPGGLDVRVDTANVTTASETPATGGFTLAFAPSSIEEVFARWIVA